MQRTLVLLKPDAVQRGLAGDIISRLERRGLRFVAMKLMLVSNELARKHYAEHVGKPFFDGLVSFITSSPIIAMVVEGEGVVEIVRATMGALPSARAPLSQGTRRPPPHFRIVVLQGAHQRVHGPRVVYPGQGPNGHSAHTRVDIRYRLVECRDGSCPTATWNDAVNTPPTRATFQIASWATMDRTAHRPVSNHAPANRIVLWMPYVSSHEAAAGKKGASAMSGLRRLLDHPSHSCQVARADCRCSEQVAH